MARTPEEKAANAAIESAIIAYAKAYQDAHPDSTYGTLTDWILVAAETKPNMDDPDEDITAYNVVMTGGGIPSYRALGLLHIGIEFLGAE